MSAIARLSKRAHPALRLSARTNASAATWHVETDAFVRPEAPLLLIFLFLS